MAGTGLIFLVKKQSTSDWINTEHGEEICRDAQAGNSFRLIAAREIEITVGVCKSSDLEIPCGSSEVNEVGRRCGRFRPTLFQISFPDHYQLIRVCIG